MESLDFPTLAAIVGMGFISAFIDAIVGGGGLISIPTLMWAGLPMLNVLGTNKLASFMGVFISLATFIKSGKVDKKMLRVAFPLAFIGAIIGVMTVRVIPSDFLRPLVVVLLVIIAVYSILRKDWGNDNVGAVHVSHKRYLIGTALIPLLGFYDGFFGPGTGSFLIFLFLMMGYGFVGATANAKIANCASNFASVIMFCYFGLINFSYALPMGGGMMIGAYCGARMAITKGTAYIRPIFISMTIILIGKQLIELFR